jgi:hypothetical protein
MEYIVGSQTFSNDDDHENSSDAEGYEFEGYSIEVNKKIDLTPSAAPKTR